MSKKQRELKELQVQRTALVKDRTRQLETIKTEITTRLSLARARALDFLHSIPGIG